MRIRMLGWGNGKTLLLGTMSALAVACGAADNAQDGQDEPSGLTLPSAFAPESGLRFVEVVANGSGCPTGSWKADIAADRRSFTVALDDYAAKTGAGQSLAAESCSLAIRVAGDVSYAVESFGFGGRAELDRGATAAASASYAIQGEPTADEVRVSLVGPHREDFQVHSVVAEETRRWSTCGVERDLNFRTQLRATSGVEGASASISVAALGGALAPATGLHVRFAVRECGASSAPVGVEPRDGQVEIAPETPRTDWDDTAVAPSPDELEWPEGPVVVDVARGDLDPNEGPSIGEVTRTDRSGAGGPVVVDVERGELDPTAGPVVIDVTRVDRTPQRGPSSPEVTRTEAPREGEREPEIRLE